MVDKGALAVEEAVARYATEDKATLQRPQSHHPMEERDQQPILTVQQTPHPTPTKTTTIGICVFCVDMTSRAGTPAPPVIIANKDIR